MPRYRLTIEYEGSAYAGWQRQESLMTVQQALEEAVEQFTHEQVRFNAAGRTDAGVHASGQVAHFDLEKEWDTDKVCEAMNGILKVNDHAIAIIDCIIASPDFDARFSAKRRHYRYRIVNRRAPLALERGLAWHVFKPLDVAAMHEAAQRLVGHHDFTTFRDANCQAKSPMKTLDVLDVVKADNEHIDVIANSRSFLHSQVRSMVGSLKLVGEGKWIADDLAAVLEARNRKACGPVAPPDGLYLEKVDY
ncbi:MAG: tRNA pseudouridine(38-40) synthase TruA [Salaquimonas sp.]|jgi:tRNA pseudouridine38-40 synthase|nr:tRNA pseudouridine(38-40) synthase TruA [Salaquimonas sp.]